MRVLVLLVMLFVLSAGAAYSAVLAAADVADLGGGSARVQTSPCRLDRSRLRVFASGGSYFVDRVSARVRCDASGQVRIFYTLSTDSGTRSGDQEVTVNAGADTTVSLPVSPSLQLGEWYTLTWDLGPAR